MIATALKISLTRSTVLVAAIVSLSAMPANRAVSQPPQGPIQSRVPVYRDRITPHWFHGNSRFWYRNDLRAGTKEFILVDAEQGKRQPAFDHAKLATGLSKAADKVCKPDRLPFDEIEFVDDDKVVRFKVGEKDWKEKNWECDLTTYEIRWWEDGARDPPPKP